jgi:16S rRNA C1402 (ribose-2'-O) methylase RsmI
MCPRKKNLKITTFKVDHVLSAVFVVAVEKTRNPSQVINFLQVEGN